MKKKLIFVIFFIITLSGISKVHSTEADVFVQSTVNRAAQALSNNFSKNQKIEKLKFIAEDTVDIQGIGMYTLGSYRKNLSDSQKKKYEILLKEYFISGIKIISAPPAIPELKAI